MSFIFLHLEEICCCFCKQLAHFLKTPVSDSAQTQINRCWVLSRTFQFLSHSLTLGCSHTGNLCPRKLAHKESDPWTLQLWVICMREGMKSLCPWRCWICLATTLKCHFAKVECFINLGKMQHQSPLHLKFDRKSYFSEFSPQLNNLLILFFFFS